MDLSNWAFLVCWFLEKGSSILFSVCAVHVLIIVVLLFLAVLYKGRAWLCLTWKCQWMFTLGKRVSSTSTKPLFIRRRPIRGIFRCTRSLVVFNENFQLISKFFFSMCGALTDREDDSDCSRWGSQNLKSKWKWVSLYFLSLPLENISKLSFCFVCVCVLAQVYWEEKNI